MKFPPEQAQLIQHFLSVSAAYLGLERVSGYGLPPDQNRQLPRYYPRPPRHLPAGGVAKAMEQSQFG
ncbi:MAG: hypothetical protein PVG66_12995 [Chromatiales bacterium]